MGQCILDHQVLMLERETVIVIIIIPLSLFLLLSLTSTCTTYSWHGQGRKMKVGTDVLLCHERVQCAIFLFISSVIGTALNSVPENHLIWSVLGISWYQRHKKSFCIQQKLTIFIFLILQVISSLIVERVSMLKSLSRDRQKAWLSLRDKKPEDGWRMWHLEVWKFRFLAALSSPQGWWFGWCWNV